MLFAACKADMVGDAHLRAIAGVAAALLWYRCCMVLKRTFPAHIKTEDESRAHIAAQAEAEKARRAAEIEEAAKAPGGVAAWMSLGDDEDWEIEKELEAAGI